MFLALGLSASKCRYTYEVQRKKQQCTVLTLGVSASLLTGRSCGMIMT